MNKSKSNGNLPITFQGVIAMTRVQSQAGCEQLHDGLNLRRLRAARDPLPPIAFKLTF